MTGYDKSRIVDVSSNELDEFTCGICYGIFNEPVVTQCCRQTYCKVCINEWLTSNPTCPNDRKTLKTDDLSPLPRFVINLLINMKIKCDYDGNGCKTIVKIGELGEHIKTCQHGPNAKCETCGLEKNDAESHDCIAELIIRNKSISDELERLSKETIMVKFIEVSNFSVNSHFFQQGPSATIDTARNALDDYVIEMSLNIDKERHKIVEFCRSSILEFDSYERITRNLSDTLNYSAYIKLLSGVKKWMTIAFNAKGGESSVESDKYLRIIFGELIIEVFAQKR